MVSIIIPIYNEEKNIRKLQDNLSKLKGNFEVIFCDGGSSDNTVNLIEDCYIVLNSPKGRANQMNYGSKFAKGYILFFLHCDSIIEEDVIIKIQEEVNRGCKVGCLKLKYDNEIIWMQICAFMSNLRVKLRKIAFGDQGIFIKKELFEEMYKQGTPIRLIGMRVDNLEEKEKSQISLFDYNDNEKREKLDKVVDDLKQKYGYNSITRAGKLHSEDKIKLKDI